MLYKYITNNNLEERQNYMYSAYGGIEFITAYINSRKEFLCMFASAKDTVNEAEVNTYIGDEKSKLRELYLYIKGKRFIDEAAKKQLDFFIKVFELRKRIYNQYKNGSYKPVEESGYENYRLYIIFGLVLGDVYEKTGNIVYLNTLLKLNDLLLSLTERVSAFERQFIAHLANQELAFIEKLMKSGSWPAEVEKWC